MEDNRTPGAILRDIECYSANLSEFAKELRMNLIDPNTDEFRKVDLSFAVSTVNSALSKVKETLSECEGRTLEINLPDTPVWSVIKVLLQVLNIKL